LPMVIGNGWRVMGAHAMRPYNIPGVLPMPRFGLPMIIGGGRVRRGALHAP
jgi:hypothetical protein